MVDWTNRHDPENVIKEPAKFDIPDDCVIRVMHAAKYLGV